MDNIFFSFGRREKGFRFSFSFVVRFLQSFFLELNWPEILFAAIVYRDKRKWRKEMFPSFATPTSEKNIKEESRIPAIDSWTIEYKFHLVLQRYCVCMRNIYGKIPRYCTFIILSTIRLAYRNESRRTSILNNFDPFDQDEDDIDTKIKKSLLHRRDPL